MHSYPRLLQGLLLCWSLLVATCVYGHTRVHVLMPVYNTENYIEQSIESITHQSYADHTTLILLDDASPDNAIEKATQLLKNQNTLEYTIIRNAKNGGRGHARIQLVKHSKAINPDAHILWLDSDDYYNDPDFIEKFATSLESTQADICLFSYEPYFELDELKASQEAEIIERRNISETIIKQICETPSRALAPEEIEQLYQFTMMGCLKGYASHFEIPEPEHCDYEDIISIVSLLKAQKITAIESHYRPLTYVKRSSSITGKQTVQSFFDIIRQ